MTTSDPRFVRMITIPVAALLVATFSSLVKTSLTLSGITIFKVHDGGVDTIYCDVQGILNASISWVVDGSKLSEINGTGYPNFNVSKSGSLVVMNPLMDRHGGLVNVTCIANSTAGNTTRISYQVMLLKAPRILTNSSTITIIEFLTAFVKIDCETTGYPKPVTEWKFGNQSLNASQGRLRGMDGVNVLNMSSYRVFSNGTIRIDNPLSRDHVPHENFTCVARNIAGEESRTHNFYIVKLISYNFEVVLPKEELSVNLQYIVQRKIAGVFQPGKLFYAFNITSINFTSRTVHFKLTWLVMKLKKFYGEPTDVTKLNEDIFDTLIKGKLNPESLQMNAPPGPPVDLTADKITSNEVTISWKPPKYFVVTSYHVEISSDSTSIWRDIKRVDGHMNRTVLDNLDPDTKYLVRIASKNSHGVGKIKSKTLLVETNAAKSVVVIVVVVILVFLSLLGLALGLEYYCRRQKKRKELVESYALSIPGVSSSNIYIRDNKTFCTLGSSDDTNEQYYFSWNEIPRKCLSMGAILGEGQFGLVQKAIWQDERNDRKIPVAVKTVKGVATETDRKELFKELKLMADVAEHPNVAGLVGACSREGPLLIIVEFCEHGELLCYLKENRREVSSKEGGFVTSLDPITRARFAYDVAKGMGYLEDKKIVHRDLAARNVLLGENRIAKVADFGLSRDIYERGLYEMTTGGKLPVRWMAIESLQDGSCDSKSDVWSFGVLFWEIETAGLVPYMDTAQLLQYLQEGHRLPKPSETSTEIYGIMKSCWEASPEVRPCFKDLQTVLGSYLDEHSDYSPPVINEKEIDIATNSAYVNWNKEN